MTRGTLAMKPMASPPLLRVGRVLGREGLRALAADLRLRPPLQRRSMALRCAGSFHCGIGASREPPGPFYRSQKLSFMSCLLSHPKLVDQPANVHCTTFRGVRNGAQGQPDSAAQEASKSESDAEQRPKKRRKERQKGGKIPKRDSSRSKAFFKDLL